MYTQQLQSKYLLLVIYEYILILDHKFMYSDELSIYKRVNYRYKISRMNEVK